MFHGASTLVRAFFNSSPPVLSNGEAAPLQADASGKLLVANAAIGATTDAAQTNTANAGSAIAWLKGLVSALGATGDAKVQDGDTAATLIAHVKGINEAANSADAVNVTLNATASGTLARHRKSTAASTNPTVVKAAAGQIYSLVAGNRSATAFFVKFYDIASAPTVGTTPIVWSVLVPAGQTVVAPLTHGLPFTAGIAYAVTQSEEDAGTDAVAADDGTINLAYI